MRFILGFLLFLFVPVLSQAKDFTDKYIPIDMRTLTLFAGNLKTFNLQDNNVFSEYLEITECDIYNTVKNSQFKQQEIREVILKKIDAQKEQKELYLRLPVTFTVTNYNFDTQALTVEPKSQMRKVNMLSIGDRFLPVCNEKIGNDLNNIPYAYKVKLNYPISLLRVPVQKDIAENLFAHLDAASSDGKTRIIYGNVYLQVDSVQPKMIKDGSIINATLYGQVNAVDLYRDQDRDILLKRLDYSEQ